MTNEFKVDSITESSTTTSAQTKPLEKSVQVFKQGLPPSPADISPTVIDPEKYVESTTPTSTLKNKSIENTLQSIACDAEEELIKDFEPPLDDFGAEDQEIRKKDSTPKSHSIYEEKTDDEEEELDSENNLLTPDKTTKTKLPIASPTLKTNPSTSDVNKSSLIPKVQKKNQGV